MDLSSSKEPSISVQKRMDISGTELLLTSTSLFIASGCLRIYSLSIGDSIPEYPDVIAERGAFLIILLVNFLSQH